MGLFKFLRKRAKRLAGRLMGKPRCNICGRTKFRPGPGRRLSATGKPPLCIGCRSLERHRAFHKILRRLDPARFKSWSCLQFSQDPTAVAAWFGSFEVSEFGKANSLDLQSINRADGSYDVVICNHILEHVADHRAALRELARILSPRGFLLLSVPDPYRRARTEDWGYPKREQHGHYRIYGRDIETLIAEEIGDCHVIPMVERDDATGVVDMAFVITRNGDLRDRAQRC